MFWKKSEEKKVYEIRLHLNSERKIDLVFQYEQERNEKYNDLKKHLSTNGSFVIEGDNFFINMNTIVLVEKL